MQMRRVEPCPRETSREAVGATKCFSIRKLENPFPLSCPVEIFHRDSRAVAREMQIAYNYFMLNVIHIFH